MADAFKYLSDIQSTTPNDNEVLASQLTSLGNNFSSVGGTPLTAILQGVTKGLAASETIKGTKKRKESNEKLIKQARTKLAMEEYQAQLDNHYKMVEGQVKEQNLLKITTENNQAAIDTAIQSAMQYGDSSSLNELISSLPVLKRNLQGTLPEGVALQGVRYVDGNLEAVGRSPDGEIVIGLVKPAGEFLSDKARAGRMDQRLKDAQAIQAEADATRAVKEGNLFDLERRKLEADVQKAEREASGQGKEYTQAQTTNGGFATRIEDAGSTIDNLAGQGVIPGLIDVQLMNSDIGNMALDSDTQRYFQASRNLINAILRKESGAVISEEEFDNARRQYIPLKGDEPDVIADKKRNREQVLNAYIQGSGGFYNQLTGGQGQSQPNGQTGATGLQGLTKLPEGFTDNGDGTVTGADGRRYAIQQR